MGAVFGSETLDKTTWPYYLEGQHRFIHPENMKYHTDKIKVLLFMSCENEATFKYVSVIGFNKSK